MVSLIDKDIKELIRDNRIYSEIKIEQSQVQPSSIDLRLGDKAYVVPCSFLPIGKRVGDFVRDIKYDVIPLYNSQVLYPGNVYIIPLLEEVSLHKNIFAHSNPKSSSGRIDIFVRLLADNVSHYDYLPCGYKGKLYVEIIPQSFPIRVKEGVSLLQLRFFKEDSKVLSNDELKRLWNQDPLVYSKNGSALSANDFIENNGVYLTVDLPEGVVGYKAKSGSNLIDTSITNCCNVEDYFDKVYSKNGTVILEKGSFYILSTKEYIKLPKEYSSEIVPIDPSLSDLRSHYAGFIDPGWGTGENGNGKGAPIVLEVRTTEHNFLIRDGQRMAKFEFVKNNGVPQKIYGGVFNNYHMQTKNRLAKFFKK